MADKKTRAALEELFSAGKIPSQVNFSELIASGINQTDDGIQKAGDTALKIQAPTKARGLKDMILLYEDFKDDKAKWSMGIRAGGLEISHGDQPDFLIDANGNVGIGTNKPLRRLEVNNAMRFTNSAADPNDGVVGTATWAPGLNIVGINSDKTFRKLTVWGEITQLQNNGANNWAGHNLFAGNVGIGTVKPLGSLSVGDSSVDGSDGFLIIGKRRGGGTRHVRLGYDDDFNFVIGDYGHSNAAGTWSPQFALAWNAPANCLRIDPAGKLIRRMSIATGLGPNDGTDSGQIASRVLKINKHRADTALRILYCDNLRVYGDNVASRWEIRIDGTSPPGGAIYQDKYGSAGNFHEPTTIVGYAVGVPAGEHWISIWVSVAPGYSVSDAYTGWNNSRWTIEVEEVWI